MNIELQFIKFRVKQFFRILRSIGWINLLVITPMIFIFILTIIENLQNKFSPYYVLIYAIVVMMTHAYRKDDNFLKKIGVSRFILYTLEYSLMCLPLSFIFCWIGYYWIAAIGHLIIIFLSALFLKYNPKFSSSAKNWRLAFVPDTLFEWKSSIRVLNYKFIFIWLLGLATSINIYAYFFFILFFISIISETFKSTEGKEFRPVNTKQLLKKLKYNTYLMIILIIPHIIIFILSNITYWYIIIGVVLYLFLYQIYCILYKYRIYSQYRDSSNQLPAAIFAIICPLLPISIPIIIFSFFKAKNRIQYA